MPMDAGRLDRRGSPRTLLRFLCVGGSATALQYALLVALVQGLGLAPVVASTLAYAVSAAYNYFASHAFTFRSRRAHRSAMPRFVLVSAVGIVLNAAVVWMCFDQFHLHYLGAQVAATIVTLCWNYLVSLRWTFAA